MSLCIESFVWGTSGKAFNMQGVKYVWNGKVFKQNHVSVDVKHFKVSFYSFWGREYAFMTI